MMQPAAVAQLVGPWLEGVQHRIVRAATYRFHGLIAERWKVGRVFLAGDAAHQTPPFFGQGMCHGLRDVANLAWKLALVAQGTASSELLETYQAERDPHVRAVISAAVEAGRYICMLDPSAAAERDAAMRERMKQTVPATAADLIPGIDAGVIATGTPAAGERFIQPLVEGRPLDAMTGGGWCVFAKDATSARHAAAQWLARLANIPVTTVDVSTLADEGVLRSWLATRGISAAIVRPDFYVFGSSASDDTDALIGALEQKLLRAGSTRERAA
jgi:3-(3-hydroxy-phenyl)propionate hydroxylase